jgi:hypothetical protein
MLLDCFDLCKGRGGCDVLEMLMSEHGGDTHHVRAVRCGGCLKNAQSQSPSQCNHSVWNSCETAKQCTHMVH